VAIASVTPPTVAFGQVACKRWAVQPLGYLAVLLMVVASVGPVMVLSTPRMIAKLPPAQVVIAGKSSPIPARPSLSLGHLVRGLLVFVVGAGGLVLV
jgi:hypothetical protein